MNNIEASPSVPAETPERQSWLDLILYLVVGFGGFLAAGYALRGVLRQPSLGSSALIYALNITCFFGSVALVGVARGKLSWAEIGFWPPRWEWIWLVWAVGILAVFNPIRIVLALAIEYLVTGSLSNLMQSARMQIFAPGGFSWAAFLVTLVMAGILAPIAEEMFFRGAIFTWFRRRYSLWIAVLASSSLFALGHADTFAVVITSLLLGIVNALVFERTRSIWAPIAIHALNNSIAVILVYLTLAAGVGK
jgi:membrane protease YdiL (CAAX protease family)